MKELEIQVYDGDGISPEERINKELLFGVIKEIKNIELYFNLQAASQKSPQEYDIWFDSNGNIIRKK